MTKQVYDLGSVNPAEHPVVNAILLICFAGAFVAFGVSIVSGFRLRGFIKEDCKYNLSLLNPFNLMFYSDALSEDGKRVAKRGRWAAGVFFLLIFVMVVLIFIYGHASG